LFTTLKKEAKNPRTPRRRDIDTFPLPIRRNIRFLLPLMVNVEVLVSYQLSTRSGGRPGIGKRNDE
jgi:hypothetical protein